MGAAIDLKGTRFGRLVVTGRTGNDRYGRARWSWLCECGTQGESDGQHLRTGNTRSCGCLPREQTAARSITHSETVGRRWTAEYRAHNGMLRRCYETGHISYPRYGGRGITVCDRWRFGEGGKTGVECFIEDMGRKPSPQHSVDRVENDGDYGPGNCRWATRLEQSANSRRSRRVMYRGKQMTLRQAWELAGRVVDRYALRRRLYLGWSVEKALETPTGAHHHG